MNKIVKDALTLTLITLIAGLALGVVYKVTEGPIAVAQYNTQQNAYKEVFPDADSFSDLADFSEERAAAVLAGTDYAEDDSIVGCVEALDASGNLLGYVVSVTSHKGFGGDITFSVGINVDGSVNGIAFTSISETAGLGMKAKDAAFKDQFAGSFDGTLAVTKDGGTIDAISGATITSRAVTNGVNAAILYFESLGGGANE